MMCRARRTTRTPLSPAGAFEPERLRRRFEVGARAARQCQRAVLQCVVAQLLDCPAEVAADPGDRGPENRDLVTSRDAVRDLDAADELCRAVLVVLTGRG